MQAYWQYHSDGQQSDKRSRIITEYDNADISADKSRKQRAEYQEFYRINQSSDLRSIHLSTLLFKDKKRTEGKIYLGTLNVISFKIKLDGHSKLGTLEASLHNGENSSTLLMLDKLLRLTVDRLDEVAVEIMYVRRGTVCLPGL